MVLSNLAQKTTVLKNLHFFYEEDNSIL